jgi:L-gulono-1,4-lactone dehydrogenase
MALQLRSKFSTRTRWRNHTANQGTDPLRIYRPRGDDALERVVEIVDEAERSGCAVRAVGSGHSWSDVTLTGGFLIETHGLNRILDVDAEPLRDGVDRRNLVYTEAGIRLRELNRALDESGLALSNMGGYDAQTVAGVISTSTHGSGLEFGPIADSIRSLDVVGSGGAVYRIEPEHGPTDRARYERRHPERTLVQDEQWFHSTVVGMGCMGIVCAAIVAVEPKYWLKEVRTLSTWSQLKSDLLGGDLPRQKRHYELLFNPYRRDGDNRFLITTREKVSQPTGLGWARRSRNLLPEIAGSIPSVTGTVLDFLAGLRPSWTPGMLDWSLKSIADDEYTDVSYKVLNIGTANLLPAYSAEIGVPIDGRHVEAVERIIEIAERHRRLGAMYHTAPISLRFVKASPAFMSMMHGRDTMMIELIQMTHTEGGFELLGEYEEALYALGGRPHWGQVNTLTGSHGFVESMYPRYREWQEVHGQLNATGVFNSPFSKRVGITASRFLA